ncbi:MAG: ATP-binding protein [Acidimicrobiia bacterium]
MTASLGLGNARLSPHAVVAELGEAALNDLEPAQLSDLAVRLVCDVLNVQFAAILVGDGDTGAQSFGAAAGWEEHDLKSAVADAWPLFELTLSAEGPVIFGDMAGEARFTPWNLLVQSRVTSGVTVAVPGRRAPFGVLGSFSTYPRQFSADEIDFIRSVAHILGSRMQAESDEQSQERGLRYQAALAECAQALLVGVGKGRLERAAHALLSATDAESVFIERNVEHPVLGLCSRTVAEADRPGTPAAAVDETYDYWDLTPWDQMPISRSHMEKGEPFMFFPQELEGVERDLYAADPFSTKSELDIPIFVNGEWTGVIAFSESIEPRDWGEEDLSLLTAAAQMVGAYWESEDVNERLRHLVDSKDQLIASVSHELRTPLTSVVGFAKLLEIEDSELTPEDRASVIRTIAEEGVDLANIIDDLLVAAKAESGTLAVVAVSIDLRAQVAQVVEACRPEDAARISVAPATVRAVGDPARVRQILRNLISNALRHGGEKIRVDLATDDEVAVVAVADDGPGIAHEQRDRVFESYYRGQKDPGLAGSMGLGLSISLELAKAMEGSLTYRYVDRESVFELTLPRKDWQL